MKGELKIHGWDSPAGLPAGRQGRFRVAQASLRPGHYWLHHVYGEYLFCNVEQRGRFTRLQQRRKGKWQDWMTDEPLHWMSMYDLAQRCVGPSVLVGGLGLGLVLRHLRHQPSIESVAVVERSPEVIDLVWEPLQRQGVLDERFTLYEADFFGLWHIRNRSFATVITDFWVGSPTDRHVQELFLDTWEHVNQFWPDALQLYHGVEPWADRLKGLLEAGVYAQLRRTQVLGILAADADAAEKHR